MAFLLGLGTSGRVHGTSRRVQRIRKKDGNRVFDYHNEIDLLDRPEGVELQCCCCNRIKGQCIYKYDSIDHLFIELESIIATTNLS